jgi:hypothetical protein
MAATTKINGKDYEVTCTLIDLAENKRAEVSPNAINSIEIHESFFDPWPSGSICISSPYNTLEDEYQYRGNGQDVVYIKIRPVGGEAPEAGREEIEYRFIASEEQNIIDDGTPAKNMKCFVLVHRDKFILRQTQPQAAENKLYTGWAGDVLKEIFKDAEPWLGNSAKLEMSDTGSLGIWFEKWSPPSHYRYLDMIQYILRMTVKYAGDGGPKQEKDLVYERGYLRMQEEGKYYLLWYGKDLAAKNKELTLEVVVTGDLADRLAVNGANPEFNKPYELYGAHITSIGYNTPGTSYNNSLFMNQLVVSYDNEMGEFVMNEVRLKDQIKPWKDLNVTPFRVVDGAVNEHLNLGELKLVEQWRTIRLPYKPWQNRKIVCADLWHTFNFLQLESNINILGKVNRQPGFYINVVRATQTELVYDSKMLGTWFISDVSHVMLRDTYRTELRMTKNHTGKGAKPA